MERGRNMWMFLCVQVRVCVGTKGGRAEDGLWFGVG
jgi:hypothetical protein